MGKRIYIKNQKGLYLTSFMDMSAMKISYSWTDNKSRSSVFSDIKQAESFLNTYTKESGIKIVKEEK